jgi:putative glutamine amidotransferase
MPPRALSGFVLGGGADVTEPLLSQPIDPVERSPQKTWWSRTVDNLLALFALMLRFLLGTRRHGADRARDALELEVIEYCKAHGLPVLGICRGAQLMNIAEGGTLLRDVSEFYEERADLYTVLPRRKVLLGESSRLGRIVGTDPLFVNSLHFHAIRAAAPELRVVARETSGVPQAIEHTSRPFWIGVQWHPEYLPQRPRHQRLFQALVDCARRTMPDPEQTPGALETR